jgi:uncharacterized protein YlxW (UPF0749 family)
MTLLTEVTARPLDGGYAEAARRKAAGESPVWPGRWALVLVAALALGLAATWGVRALRSPGEAEQRTRLALENRAADTQTHLVALRERTNELAAQVEALENQALSRMDPTAAARARALAIAAGSIPVGGPGLVVTVSEDAAAIAAGSDDARIRAGDLRIVVGALWESGAEAIAVGGVRLASNTAIRDVGDQVQVGFESLGAPYDIWAIGPAEQMQVGLASGRAADRISLLKGYLGATVDIQTAAELELPASALAARLEHADLDGLDDLRSLEGAVGAEDSRYLQDLGEGSNQP